MDYYENGAMTIRLDDELKGYLSAPANTPFFKQFQL